MQLYIPLPQKQPKDMSLSPFPPGHVQNKARGRVFCKWLEGKGGRHMTIAFESIRPTGLTMNWAESTAGAVQITTCKQIFSRCRKKPVSQGVAFVAMDV